MVRGREREGGGREGEREGGRERGREIALLIKVGPGKKASTGRLLINSVYLQMSHRKEYKVNYKELTMREGILI